MAEYRLSQAAKMDLIRIHHFGVQRFGLAQADKYFNSFFQYFEIIAQRPYSFESVDFIKEGYRRCVCGSDSIYFRIKNGKVEIMAIVGRQDLNSVL
ncbi:type II toxin-antitoxin system RelE/ParE family toxin [Algoriphagus algorifonticola]|uniref:type II toxin-antitoxin system RelE/ParE family toxin n=1 Tax=Algoriphagus algorifonticola TaxID=2593007 RepID=UPI00119E5577|nr:type II toxin-antitoxin system RelE/ParE family toxin [Algoriphagus algorifonticola]